MKYVQVPIQGGEIKIDTRMRTVSLVLAVEDGSRTVRVRLSGASSDQLVRHLVKSLHLVTTDALEELMAWGNSGG